MSDAIVHKIKWTYGKGCSDIECGVKQPTYACGGWWGVTCKQCLLKRPKPTNNNERSE